MLKKFEKAIDNAHGGVSLNSIGSADEEKDGEVALSNYNNAEINTDIISLIEKVQDGNFKPNEKVYLGVVSNGMAQEIENIVGFSVQGFKVVIEARQIEHIIKDHGEKGKTDQSMKNPEDLGKIEYVLDNADSVIKSGRTQAYSYMKDGRNRTAETILYEKVIGEKSYYVVQAVPDTKAKTLYIVSAFIGKSGYKKEASQLINAKGPDATAKTGSESASTDIIPENGENVNDFDERKSVQRSYEPGKKARDKKITLGMSDAERTEVLKNKSIKLSAETNNEKIEQAQEKHEFTEESFNLANFADKRGLVIKVGDEFGVFKNYHNEDIELSFQYSRNNAREGMDKQKKQYYDFVKMLSCFDLVIENAVGIEMHNRNSEGYKKDITLKNMYVLASAFVDGDEVVPVKLEIKEFTDKPSSLYVAIALERIGIKTIKKDGVVVQEVADNSVAQQVTRPSSISIAEYFKNINPKDESFYKYIPKPFLNGGVDLSERYSKKRSYNPAEDTDIDDEGNIWVEDEEGGVKVIFSTPDFGNPIYEKNHAPGYRLSDTYDGDNPEAYVIEGKQNILSENSQLKKFVADNIKLKKYSRKDASSILFEIMTERGYFDGINAKFIANKFKSQAGM